ncbi:hypothetical protein MUN77_11275 [Leucobacter allii]|uniref:DUF2975 domain-containing protein n=1 Tax=Leucobacter allii TaxID=2932247 RepID=UPI001FD57458|nr:hypothetical protein [Leucobacter allii]UOR00733.1 hypothetical protein MUN77_11275 [Leucobacter allii]
MSASAREPAREPALSRGDAWGLWCFVAAGVVVAVATAVRGVLRIGELLRNSGVDVPAEFLGTTATAPIGPDGAAVEVVLDRAELHVDALPAASVAAGVLEAAVGIAATATVVILLTLLCRELVRGRIFSRRNTRLVSVAGIVWVFGAALAPFFGNMVANGAFARLSDGGFDNVVMGLELQSLIAGTFVAAFAASVFAVGDRFRRDADGLV